MLRRTKEQKDTAAPDAPAGDEDLPGPTDEDPLAERLGPLEEFRGKTDQWMKETAAQLARVATHVQQDEKRQEKLDSRLADFEDRIQAMLTLTEALSAGENPFVKSHDEQQAPSTPQEAPPQDEPWNGTASEDPQRRHHDPPTWESETEGSPAETRIVRTDIAPAPPSDDAEADGPEDPAEDERPVEAPEPRPRAAAETSTTPPARFAGHPNDPSFESYAPEEPTEPPGDPDPSDGILHTNEAHALPLDESPQLDEVAAHEAERRLILLQWAGLLARHMRRIDIEAFLETYVDTGWVTTEQVAKVRALASDLTRHAGPPAERLTREDLHIRTILLLSSLSTRTTTGRKGGRPDATDADSTDRHRTDDRRTGDRKTHAPRTPERDLQTEG